VGALIPFVAALSKATTFGGTVVYVSWVGRCTAKLISKLGRTTYVTDTENPPADPGAMSLGFLTKRLMEGLAWEAEGF